jgi:alpha-tubulin suppressor-like RCC1 family protein
MGQLGHDIFSVSQPPAVVSLVSPIHTLSCGLSHVLLCTTNGDVWGWGRGIDGQLGATKEIHLSPKKIEVPLMEGHNEALPCTNVSCGWGHSLALLSLNENDE